MQKPRIMFYQRRTASASLHVRACNAERRVRGQQIDELAGTPVEALMFCLGDGRTVLHDTEVGELWGHNVQEVESPHLPSGIPECTASDPRGQRPLAE